MWGERRPNDVILECFNCMWEVVRLRRWERLETWERLEGSEVGKRERWEGSEVGKIGRVGAR